MSPLEQRIRAEIEISGPMPFARFMEMALYEPGLGYYEQRRPIGRAGDFFTSVSVGSLFGQLLAWQFAEWTESPAQWVEAGAHDGRLASDILKWLAEHRPDVLDRLRYIIVEPSPARQDWQRELLAPWPQVHWQTDLPETTGIIFSNEFLDALPVHRLCWNAREHAWREAFVSIAKERFVWQFDPSSLGPTIPPELAAVLPDGFVLEFCPAAVKWWNRAASRLRQGRLLAIDYGWMGPDELRPDRPNGTLRAFFRHHGGTDLLASPGQQDLTADVDFTALREAGIAAGLVTEDLLPQGTFLTRIVAGQGSVPSDIRQFQTLTHPEHLGRKFHVLIQRRAAAAK